MEKEQTFYLNGQKMRSLLTFGKELRNVFYFEDHLNLKNLNVVNDILRGGFGILNCNENYTIVWQNYKKSELALDVDLLKIILDIFKGNPNITLILD